MLAIERRNTIFENRVARIQVSELLTQVRISVSRSERHVGSETLVNLHLQRLVTVGPVVLLNPKVRELRILEQRLTARDRSCGIESTATGHQIAERVRNRGRKESVRRCIARWIGAEQLSRYEVQVPANWKIVTSRANEVGLDYDASRQLA